MSFDRDPGEQAQISGADFALMCDEMKQLKASNAELAAALEAFVAYDGANFSGLEFIGLYDTAITKCRAALANHQKEKA